jgi:VPDSG-CTERM motif
MKKIILTVLAAAFVTAQAYAFSGSVFMMGSVQTKTSKGGINTIKFGTNWKVLGAPAPDGVYTGSAGSKATLLTSLSYNMTTLATTAPATIPFQLWTFMFGGNTYSFKLDNPLTAALSTSKQLLLGGTGTAYINGRDASPAVWSLESTSGGGFKFTATSSTSAVPDDGSAVALLGIALAGIEGARRLIRARTA